MTASASAFEALRLQTQEETGLLFRDPEVDFEARVSLASREFGFDDAMAFTRWLGSEAPTRHDRDRWIAHLTVGETYFWRESEAFEALEQVVLPRLCGRLSAGALRVWSAGCSTGEEAYSLAIALTRLPHSPARLLASDLNPLSVGKAAAGAYGPWSFRNCPPWLRETYLSPSGRESWTVRPPLRKMVSFVTDNLVRPGPHCEGPWHLILCRNVLMYFSPERIQAVLAHLHRNLADGGCLLVSASELALPSAELFRAERIGSAQVFWRLP